MVHDPVPPTTSSSSSPVMRALGANEEHGVSVKRILGIVIAISALLLVVQNSGNTELHWLFFDFKAPVWVMFLITLVMGAVAWELLKRGWKRRHAASDQPVSPQK